MAESAVKRWAVAAATHVGRVRENNEDAYFHDEARGLFIVSDGMGGLNAGEVAARIVVEDLPHLVEQALVPPPRALHVARAALASCALAVSRQVQRRGRLDPATGGMGATVVLVQALGDHAHVMHVGDSRAYVWRDGQLTCLTRDHTLAALMVAEGLIKPEEARLHPLRNCLLQSIGMPGTPVPGVTTCRLHPGDRLLLCSDGLSGFVDDDQILRAMQSVRTVRAACRRLVDLALDQGGLDNITVLLAERLA